MVDRITTTRVGTLPRSAAVTELVERPQRVGIDFLSVGAMSDIAHLKPRSRVEGAQIASGRLWR